MNDLDRIQEAVLGQHGEKQRALAGEGLAWLATVLRKNTDYAASAYSPPLLLPRMRADTAILVRMSDKAYRIASLIEKGTNQVAGETLADAVRDLGGYCLLWLCVQGDDCSLCETVGVGMSATPKEITDATSDTDSAGDPVPGALVGSDDH